MIYFLLTFNQIFLLLHIPVSFVFTNWISKENLHNVIKMWDNIYFSDLFFLLTFIVPFNLIKLSFICKSFVRLALFLEKNFK